MPSDEIIAHGVRRLLRADGAALYVARIARAPKMTATALADRRDDMGRLFRL